tara:strand:- start:80 stop:376 length:297 start_codon:yes stop_codon:yes gene_type:complete
MSRYDDTEQGKSKFGKRVYKTTIYPRIKKQNSDIYITSKYGDRLDVLAHKYYKNADLWWIIAQANHIGKGTLVIEGGIQLRIPTEVGDILAELEDINN